MIGIFTHRRATEADRVVRALHVAGHNVVRLNSGHLEAQVSVSVGGQGRAPVGVASCDGRQVRSGDLSAAWLHQQPPAGPPELRATASGIAAESSRLRLWEAFAATVPEDRWLTAPDRLRAAGNKLIQYGFASAAGLPVPETLGSNDPGSIRDATRSPSVVKFLGDSSQLWALGEDGFATVTRRAELALIDDDVLVSSPALFQRAIASVREVRVVAVAGLGRAELFAAAGQKPPSVVDIRLAEDAMRQFEPVVLPKSVERQLVTMMGQAGIGFCSADLLCDDDERHWFVDLNATGAWWWIDDLFDREIGAAIARMLQRIANG